MFALMHTELMFSMPTTLKQMDIVRGPTKPLRLRLGTKSLPIQMKNGWTSWYVWYQISDGVSKCPGSQRGCRNSWLVVEIVPELLDMFPLFFGLNIVNVIMRFLCNAPDNGLEDMINLFENVGPRRRSQSFVTDVAIKQHSPQIRYRVE